MGSLPTELWDLIVGLLPRRDQRTCLLLSRLHRDLAFPKLFSHITASFGMWIWRPWTPEEDPIYPLYDDHISRMTRLTNNTPDLLRAVPRHPALSKAVKGLNVQAHAWSGGDEMYEERAFHPA